MKLGLELIARQPIELRLGTFFETWVATATGSVGRSLGRDEYHLAIAIAEGSRLAATGRTHICQVDLEAVELGTNGARPALLTEADLAVEGPVIWGIRTNLFLDLDDLRERASARLLTEGRPPLLFTLDHPELVVEAVAPGRYIADVRRLLST
ncbi:MAG: hypothetical protein ACOY94_21950 [Bacillota bacterium]